MKYFYKYLIIYVVCYVALLILSFIIGKIIEIPQMDTTWAAIWCLGCTLFAGIQDIINEIRETNND